MTQVYNESARRRIDRTVIQSERRRTEEQERRGRIVQTLPFAAIASEDIEHGTTGDVDMAESTTWAGTWSAATSTSASSITVYNPFLKIWSGSR